MFQTQRIFRIKKYLPIASIIWLVALLCFAWGAAMVRFDLFPYKIVRPIFYETIAFIKGHPSDKRPLLQRLRGTLTHDPFAFAIVAPTALPTELKFKHVDASSYKGPIVKFLDNAKFYSDGTLNDYFLIYGSFAFKDSNWGAILVSHKGHVLRTWSIKPSEYEYPGAHIGLALSKAGDIATNTNGVLTSYSWCGRKKWEAKWQKQQVRHDPNSVLGYDYHHDITHHEGKFYTFLGQDIISVNEMTGDIVERIHVLDLIKSARDQNLSIFDARFRGVYREKLDRSTLASLTFFDPFHFNKVDILSHDLSSSFDVFEYGDMLASMRELNLLFVFRPKTMKVLWYRYGLTTRQHDATFQRGYVSVFDNNPFSNSGFSPQIVALGVTDYSRSVLFDLRQWGVKMPTKGNFEFDDDSGVLMFSDDDNGRAIVVNLSGKPLFVFENSVGNEKILQLRNITRISPEKYREWSLKCN